MNSNEGETRIEMAKLFIQTMDGIKEGRDDPSELLDVISRLGDLLNEYSSISLATTYASYVYSLTKAFYEQLENS